MVINNSHNTHHLAGFVYHPPRSAGQLGYPELEINILAEPMNAFFDTRWARFPVVGLEGDIGHATVRHPWHGAKRYDVCVGRIVLGDFEGRLVETFSLGGELTITGQQSMTTCKFTSPAPIFDLANPFTAVEMLVIELEALLARQHAEWGTDDRGFERCLAGIDPKTLYVAGVVAVVERLREVPPYLLDVDRYRQVVRDLSAVIDDLHESGDWPQSAPTLDDLL